MSESIVYTHSYPYRRWGKLYKPIVLVELFFEGYEKWKGPGLIDTGADYPIFDAEIAKSWFDINLQELRAQPMEGMSSTGKAYIQPMQIRIEPLSWPVPCDIYFVEGLNPRLPNLLGRNGLFEHLQIGIDEASGKIYMRENA